MCSFPSWRTVCAKEDCGCPFITAARPTQATVSQCPNLYGPFTDNELNSVPDGKICKNDSGELAVTKFAVEPAWYLPGVAERFGIGEFPGESLRPLVPAILTRCR